MHSPAAATPTYHPSITNAIAPVTSQHQHEHDDTPDRLPSKPPASTNDFHLDTFFNPVWTSGPHVFSFAENGTVVRPETYAPEPYPGYHADRFRRPESVNTSHSQNGIVARPGTYAPVPHPGHHADGFRCLESVNTSHFQGSSSKDLKPWKNVAITEQDDAEFAAFRERMRVGALGEWRERPPYAYAQRSMREGQEPAYNWPPKPHGW